MASFFDEIARNRIKSIILLILFGLFFFAIVAIAALYFGFSPGIGLIIAGVIIILYGLFVYTTGDKFVLRMSGAKEADKAQYSTLYSVVEGLAAAEQVPVPKVYIINDPNPNAFATGRNKKHASIAVTSGLLAMMNKQELEGVIAHEASHIGNNDIQLMMVAVVFAGAIGIIAGVIRMTFFFGGMGGGGGRNNNGMILLIGLAIGLLAPLFALLIRLAISRRREYMADANGARITRSPSSLASALVKIRDYSAKPQAQPVRHANEVTASLYFSNPFKASSIMNIFSTHPPIDERIKRLQQMY
ncbi:MAG TPA: M48 family metallopeptidase [Candidatus Saccharimonadales bacterium]|nr:M48 family metallopeptidase [Candidatus Saccharimonadales bacterium]